MTLLSIHKNEYNSVIFAPRSFKFCVLVDIEVTDKLGKNYKRGVAPRGRGTCEYTLKWAQFSHFCTQEFQILCGYKYRDYG